MRSSKILIALILTAALGCTAASSMNAAITNIFPSKDNTLYEFDPAEGDHSNGAGFHFFAGENGMGELRRGVLAFDIAGSIPPGSTITAVSLSLNMSMTPAGAITVELHKLLADWGEGTSHAPMGEGDGAPATPNDATWRHRFFDTIFWTTQGGDFSATVSASQSVGAVGEYTWSSAQMVADVQSWLDNPANNFGWLVLGDETTIATAKRFDTRESTNPPVLSIEYTSAPTPTPTPTPIVTPTPTPSGITLSAHGRRVQGRHTVDLTWSPVTSANIDIYRDGVVIATVPNNGSYKDFIGVRGGNARYTYKVCDAGTQNCSNEVTVRFGGPPI